MQLRDRPELADAAISIGFGRCHEKCRAHFPPSAPMEQFGVIA